MTIAVVGSGISGLGAAWLLAPEHNVRVFERDSRIGGHTHTHQIAGPEGNVVVDSGFIVYNNETYPLLTTLFDALGVRSQATDMSFSLECERCRLVYSGLGLRGVFADAANVLRPNFLSFLAMIGRFLDRLHMLAPLSVGVVLFGIGWWLEAAFPGLGTTGWQMLGWGLFVSTALLYHTTFLVKSVAHMSGRRRYDTKDDSRNNWWVALLTLGEGWHNNHHRYPSSERQGFYWWELDATHYALRVLEKLGLVWDLRAPPRKAFVD